MNVLTCCTAIMVFLCPAMPESNYSTQRESELEVLGHYVGVWDSEFTIIPQTKEDNAKRFTGVVHGRWVVGNKFLEQTGKYQLDDNSPPFVIMTMMSYDKKLKEYRYDYFNSSGDIQQSSGKWDANAKTMTSTRAEDGNVTTIVANFSTPDVERWTIETKNGQGQTTLIIKGTNRRRAKNK